MVDRQVKAIVRGLEQLTERAIKKITLDTTANLIETTPVDTGWARANWVPSIGLPIDDNLSGVTPTAELASSAGARQQGALAGVAARYTLRMGSVFISNNVPYIVRLNEGSSTQAPAAFVQAAIRKAVTQDIRGLR